MIILYVLLCILLLGVLIAAHEFGHFHDGLLPFFLSFSIER